MKYLFETATITILKSPGAGRCYSAAFLVAKAAVLLPSLQCKWTIRRLRKTSNKIIFVKMPSF